MNIMKSIYFILLFGTISLFADDIQTISKSDAVLPSRLLNHYKELFGLYSFIETGTYAGDTTAEASRVFNEVHSVEIWEPLYKKAQERFASFPNVFLYCGDTTTHLNHMIENSTAKRLYWLDAHSSGEGTGGIPGFSPILSELDQILNYEGDIDSIILIDDLRGMCHCDQRTNLPLRLIIQKIEEINPDLQFYSIGDIGIIFNKQNYPLITISEIVKNASISRFFDPGCEDDEVLEKLIDAESFIASVDDKSKEGARFCDLVRWVNKDNFGGEVIYLLWGALRSLEKNELASAIDDLRLISNSFYSHWRIDAYLVKAMILDGQFDKAISLFNQKLLPVYVQHSKIIEKIININGVVLMNKM